MEHIRFFIITVGEPIFCLFSNKGKHYLIVENREWRYIHNKVLYKIITAAYLIYARRRGGGGVAVMFEVAGHHAIYYIRFFKYQNT